MIRLRAAWRRLIDEVRIGRRCYHHRDFRKADLALRRRYRGDSPYEVSKRFLLERGVENVYQYGETPIATLEQIANEAGIGSDDFVVDLGCGPGRTSLWFRFFTGARVLGVEQIPEFVERSPQGIDGLEIRLEDWLQTDFSKATVVYLYGTCLSDEELASLVVHLRTLPVGARLITVSYPIEDSAFRLEKSFEAKYTWGNAQVYLHKRIKRA